MCLGIVQRQYSAWHAVSNPHCVRNTASHPENDALEIDLYRLPDSSQTKKPAGPDGFAGFYALSLIF